MAATPDTLLQNIKSSKIELSHALNSIVNSVMSKGKSYTYITLGIIALLILLNRLLSHYRYQRLKATYLNRNSHAEVVVLQKKDSTLLYLFKLNIANFLLSIARQYLQSLLEKLSQKK